jgi:branched-chain amino acid transport system substrate-binding protein
MKETPINDFFAKNGKIREDGRMITTCTCSRSRSRRSPRAAGTTTSCSATVPGNEAFQPLECLACPLVKK